MFSTSDAQRKADEEARKAAFEQEAKEKKELQRQKYVCSVLCLLFALWLLPQAAQLGIEDRVVAMGWPGVMGVCEWG